MGDPIKTPATKFLRPQPQSELDLTLMTTNGVWGQPDVSQELITRLNKAYKTKNEEGEEGTDIQSLWGLLSFYTRDMRLANLSVWNGELNYVAYYLDLAGDLLQCSHIDAFLTALSRAATVLELSQSKGGFLRKRMNTFTSEDIKHADDPPKKSLFGGSGKKDVM